ncbi:hypothetical protein VSR01_03340 [Actinacidiphila sp. DG2A-62]|uniref:hypothetical protein n=1 Tax=Actinacidiphila sp. DG2A-62 TaxID=3108821 RepID=UPI002DBB447A|nr:hypothetical protein [Actinacidiphila sp. DG2A-62]MEC3992630.1 hypothetical protein [Actinacidiphila sp. DG2A-62]
MATNRSAFSLDVLTRGGARAVVVADFRPVSSAPRLAERLAAAVRGEAAEAEDEGRHPGRDGGERPGDARASQAAAPAAEVTICQLDPARDFARSLDDDPRAPSLDEAAAHYAELIREACPHQDVTIAADCSASALALRIAAALETPQPSAERDGGPPGRTAVVLLRPVWPDTALVREILDELRAEVRSGLRGATAAATPELAGGPDAALDAALDVLRADLDALAAQHGIDPRGRTIADLYGRYRGWLGYLLAAREALRAPWPSTAPAVHRPGRETGPGPDAGPSAGGDAFPTPRVWVEPGGSTDHARGPWFAGAAYPVTEVRAPEGAPWPGPDLPRLLLAAADAPAGRGATVAVDGATAGTRAPA